MITTIRQLGGLAASRSEEGASRIRYESMDVLRGVAVLGILFVNVLGFGLPWAAYNNPRAYGGDSGPDLLYWFVQLVLFDGKMRAIFSMLFGASAILVATRVSSTGLSAPDRYYRRMLWLMVIGAAHAYLITSNDILFGYGLVGLFLYPLRTLRPSALLCAGVIALSVLALKAVRQGQRDLDLLARGSSAVALEQQGFNLTERQRQDRNALHAREKALHLKPDSSSIAANIQRQRGTYSEQFRTRRAVVPGMHSTAMYEHDAYDVGGMMLIGMGLTQLGVLTGQRSALFYWRFSLAGYALGVPLCAVVAWQIWRGDFASIRGETVLRSTEDFGRLAVAFGHIGLIMLVLKRRLMRSLMQRLADAGRMALTNYLVSSVLCVLFFYGYGLGMYGRLARYELLYVVGTIWLMLLLWSGAWLTRFRYGPAEWVWRSLTQWSAVQMRR